MAFWELTVPTSPETVEGLTNFLWEQGALGVSTSLAQQGADIQVVEPGGPAARAGLGAGDVIVAVDGETVREPDEVSEAEAEREPGDEIVVEVLRDGERRTIRVELAKRPGP